MVVAPLEALTEAEQEAAAKAAVRVEAREVGEVGK